MEGIGVRPACPELKALVTEASQALARLDADRLEELADSCRALNREMPPADREGLARQSRDAAREMAVFRRVLEATRANVKVMERLRELRAGRLEYGERQQLGLVPRENRHGLD